MTPSDQEIISWQQEWTDQFVEVNSDQPEFRRFRGMVGRVATVNWNNRALVDFQDGAWYDIPASSVYLTKLDPQTVRAKFNSKANSAQVYPERQG
jgi:ligand-binding sensor domain-containing protein